MTVRGAVRHAAIHALEALAVGLALTIFVAAALMWRLAGGPMNADFLKPLATASLAEAFGGADATVDSFQIGYDPELSALVLSGRGVSIVDDRGARVTAADRIEAGLALDLLMIGRAAPVSVSVQGGVFSVVRSGGLWSAGVGFPDSIARGRGPEADWNLIGREADGGRLSRLRRIALSDVSLRVMDRQDGLSLLLQDAQGTARFSPDDIRVELSAGLATARGVAPVEIGLETDRGLDSLFVDASVSDLVPASIAPPRGPLRRLGRLDAPMDADIVLDAARRTGLRAMHVELTVGEGRIADARTPFSIESGRARMTYDAQAGQVEIGALEILSDRLRFSAQGRISEIGRFDSAVPGYARYTLEAGPGGVELPRLLPAPVEWTGGTLEGEMDPAGRTIAFDRLDLDVQGLSPRLSGRAALERIDGRTLPSLRLSGPIGGTLVPENILAAWPEDFAVGAREWAVQRILGGTVSNMELDLDLPAQALAEGAFDDEHLALSFDFSDAAVRYILTMPEMTRLSGSAVLRGNSLTLDGRDGRIEDMAIDTVFVDIPRLNPRGALARFGGTGRGDLGALIGLLNNPPLEIASGYGIEPAEFSGEGEVEFEITRPMLSDVPYEEIGFDVTGRFADASGPAGGTGLRFTDGDIAFETDTEGFRAEGGVSLRGGRADIVWTERFGLGDDAAETTTLEIDGRAAAAELADLGLPVRQTLNGPVVIEAELAGRGFDFSRYDVALDLAEADVVLPGDLWTKRAGRPAELALSLRRRDDGSLSLPRLNATGEGVDIRAAAELAADGRLESASFDRLFIEDVMDMSGDADRDENDTLRVRLRGAHLDATGLIDQIAQGGFGGGEPDGAPLILLVSVDDVRLRTVRYDDVFMRADTGEGGLFAFQLSGFSSDLATGIRFGDVDDGTGRRALSVDTEDAGTLLEAMSGFTNVTGGSLSLTGVAPPPGERGPVEGDLSVTGFRLDRMPLLARVLAAGSLEGLADLLGGGRGIDFERMSADYVWNDGVLEMREGRVAGPALGLTWRGVVDLSDERLAVDGTLLPSYGANALLGNLPLVGDLLVSRQGEGVIGITYSVEGPFGSARVVTNPLSALAPGVFRRIFEGTSAVEELDALEAEREADAAEPPADPE